MVTTPRQLSAQAAEPAQQKITKDYYKKLAELAEGDDARAKVRLSEQAALIMHMDQILTQNLFRAANGKEFSQLERQFQYFVKNNIDVGLTDIMANLFKGDFSYFFNNVPSKVFSAILPSLKFYKSFYPASNGEIDFSKSYLWKIPFDDSSIIQEHMKDKYSELVAITDREQNANSIENILDSNGRLNSVGIKSFKYKYVGVNPAEINSNIEAELEIFFENIQTFIKEFKINKDDKRFIKKPNIDGELTFKYSDLVVPSSTVPEIDLRQKTYNVSNFYRIKVVCGYAEPSNEILEDLLKKYDDRADISKYGLDPATVTKDLKKDVDLLKKNLMSARVILWLSPFSHDISFNENGSIILKIKYIAAIDQIMAETNILSLGEKYSELLENNEKLRKYLVDKSKSLQDANCSYGKDQKDKELKALKDEKLKIETYLSQNRLSIFSDIYANLLGLKGELKVSRVFELKVSPARLGFRTKNGSPKMFGISQFPGRVILESLKATNISPPTVKIVEKFVDEKEALRLAYLAFAGAGDPKTIKALSADNDSFDPDAQQAEEAEFVQASKELKGGGPYKLKHTSATEEKLKETDPLYRRLLETKEEKSLEEVIPEEIEKLQEETWTIKDPNNSTIGVKFIFLGDLIDVFYPAFKKKIKDPQDLPRMILGRIKIQIPIQLKDPNLQSILDMSVETQAKYINLADIPISLRSLQSFFVEKMIKEKRENYSMMSLIYDLFEYVVQPAISPAYFGSNDSYPNYPRISSLVLSTGVYNNNFDYILRQKSINEDFAGSIDPNFIAYVASKIPVQTTLDKYSTFILPEKEILKNTLNYIFFYHSSTTPELLIHNKGNLLEDLNSGIFHIKIGKDIGILKNISFSKTQNMYQKEALANREGTKNSSVLKDVYDCEITLFGNNIFRPGDFIYIEPLYFSEGEAIRLQRDLGLGGYYHVIDVTTIINENRFETKLNTVLFAHVVNNQTISLIENSSKGNCL